MKVFSYYTRPERTPKDTYGLKKTADSAIEIMLGNSILKIFNKAGSKISLGAANDIKKSSPLILVPQFRWLHYRSDYAVLGSSKGIFLIECDGRDFHSSPNQVLHDAQKDSDALSLGYRTIRFWGAQIYKDPDKCAYRILDLIIVQL